MIKALTGYTIRTDKFNGIAGEQSSSGVFNSEDKCVREFYFPFASFQAHIWVFVRFLKGHRG